MKKYLAAAALTAVSIVPMSANAETQDALTMQLSGIMPDICTAKFQAPTAAQRGGFLGFDRIDNAQATLINDNDGLQASFAFNVPNQTDPSDDTVGEINAPFIRMTADFFCNGAYSLTIQAANGAFVNSETVTNTAQFSNQLNYVLNIDIEGRARIAQEFAGETAAQEIVTNGVEIDGDIVFRLQTGQGRVEGGEDKKLIAGLYQEAITLSFVQDGTSPAIAFVNAPAASFAAN
ncbi:MAG: hypothetical protein AAF674_17635 [Pseudomonadota bacterium]